MKKILLTLGSVAAVAAPLATTVACSTSIPVSMEFEFDIHEENGLPIISGWTADVNVGQKTIQVDETTRKYDLTGVIEIDRELNSVKGITRDIMLMAEQIENNLEDYHGTTIGYQDIEQINFFSGDYMGTAFSEAADKLGSASYEFLSNFSTIKDNGGTQTQIDKVKEEGFIIISEEVVNMMRNVRLYKVI